MSNPDWNLQVKIGNGRKDIGTHHRAINIAQQLLAAGRWLDRLSTYYQFSVISVQFSVRSTSGKRPLKTDD